MEGVGIPSRYPIYDMPAHTDTVIEPKTIAKFVVHPNIIAIKDSSSVIALFNKFRVALPRWVSYKMSSPLRFRRLQDANVLRGKPNLRD